VPAGIGSPRVALFSLMVAGTPSSGPSASPPACFRGARLLERGFGPEEPGGLQLGLAALDLRDDGLRDFDRGQAPVAVGGGEFLGGKLVQ
jgi:hypothetical protein